MSEITTVELDKDIKNELLAKVNGAQNVTIERCDDVLLHAYFFEYETEKKYYHNGKEIGDFVSWEKVNDKVLLFVDLIGDKCFFMLENYDITSRQKIKKWEQIRDNLLLISYLDGEKRFLQIGRRFKWSVESFFCEFSFVRDNKIFLKSKHGSVALFNTSTMTLGPWQFE